MPFRLLTIVADLASIGLLQHAVGHIGKYSPSSANAQQTVAMFIT
jgi:hypothetical protein